MPRKSEKLNELINLLELDEYITEEHIVELDISAEFIANIENNIMYITEEREYGKIVHNLESIVLTIIFAMMANCNKITEIQIFMEKHFNWLSKYIRYDSGIPSISTIRRVLAFIKVKELEKVCNESMKNFLHKEAFYKDDDIEIKDLKAIDGKTSNSSDRRNSKNGKIAKTNAMSIYSTVNDICESTEFISKKTNEIPTAPILLSKVNIKGCVITFDAMSTQTETVKYIKDNYAHYVGPVKGNQGTLETNILQYFNDEELYKKAKSENYYCEKSKRNGDIETREYIFTNDIEWLSNKESWKGLKSIGYVKRRYRNEKGEITEDVRVYISSLDASKIELIAKCVRGEWGIENKLHYYLDTVFDEDSNTCFVDNTQKNLNVLRKFVLGLLKMVKNERKIYNINRL